MPDFKVKTRDGSDPHGKSRVYFTCHPRDLGHLNKIADDILAAIDCAIYYTEDMSAPLDETNIEVDLGRMNLFIIPITFRLLTESCRAMTDDIAYAYKHNIPIISFMMEGGIDSFYNSCPYFSNIQYLNPRKCDLSEISYEKKLSSILQSLLISDETANRIRDAFDSYVFLSYRKKDRRYANELMRRIHDFRGCQDVAIWYDEFLTPGENFIYNIDLAMEKSKLFTLLVTPNVLEDGNFIMREEYPAAKRANMTVVPAEMEKTDKEELKDKFKGIPDPISADDEGFKDRLLTSLGKISALEDSGDTEHNYLIGLAYLYGVDVEIDYKRAISLIEHAAKAGHYDAMMTAYNLCSNGYIVERDYEEAKHWAECIVNYCINKFGDRAENSIDALCLLINAHMNFGEYSNALEICERLYPICIDVKSDKQLFLMESMSVIYSKLDDTDKEMEWSKKGYEFSLDTYGEEDFNTIGALNNLAGAYSDNKEYHLALEMFDKLYKLCVKVFGEKNPQSLVALHNLASTYGDLEKYEIAHKLLKKTVDLRVAVLGEDHPYTLLSLSNLGLMYVKCHNPEKGLKIADKVWRIRKKVLGEKHPETLWSMNNLAWGYVYANNAAKACDLSEDLIYVNVSIYGKNHKSTLKVYNTVLKIFNIYIKKLDELKRYSMLYTLLERLYKIQAQLFGPFNTDTVNTKKYMDNIKQI